MDSHTHFMVNQTMDWHPQRPITLLALLERRMPFILTKIASNKCSRCRPALKRISLYSFLSTAGAMVATESHSRPLVHPRKYNGNRSIQIFHFVLVFVIFASLDFPPKSKKLKHKLGSASVWLLNIRMATGNVH